MFDDLERTNINEIDVLGCINEYCENKHIKTIIVANEDEIPESGSNEVEKAYPGFFKNSYMLSSVQQWIVEGEWDEDKIKEEIDQKIASCIAMEPKDLVRNTDLIGAC